MAPFAGAFAVLSDEIELKKKEKFNILFNKLFITFFRDKPASEGEERACCMFDFIPPY